MLTNINRNLRSPLHISCLQFNLALIRTTNHTNHTKKNSSRNGVICKANGAMFLKAYLQSRLRVGLQKHCQPGKPDALRFFSALSCHFVIFVIQIRELIAPIAAPGGAQSSPANRLSAP